MIVEIKKWISENPGKFLGFVFPLIAACGSSVSMVGKELFDSYVTGTKFGQSSLAVEQQSLWKKNFTCLQDVEKTKIKNNYNVEISTLVCPSGDVLVTAQRPDDDVPSSRWIGLDGLIDDTGVIGFSFVSEAIAQQRKGGSYLLCSYWHNDYLVKVMTDGQYCVSYMINPYNGQTVNTFASCGCGQ